MKLTRRDLGAAGLAATAATSARAAGRLDTRAPLGSEGTGAPRLGPVVETRYGKVRGYRAEGVHVFRGLRYGASTAGAGRFRPPSPPEPWPGVMETLSAGGGDLSPQAEPQFLPPNRWSTELDPDHPPMSEDCLFLNLFTPGVNDGAKRPVMVFLHGGAWASGGGVARLYDGTRLARRGDTVIVTVNHRLNLFGFLYLGDILGADYADSGNCGVLDIVAALRWVKDNIAAFGGDPNNVTLFGWSAGGSEAAQILAMPSAEGLLHKAIVQSGAILSLRSTEAATRAAEQALGRMGLSRATARDVLTLPVAQVLKGGAGGAPTFDGRSVPRQIWEPGAPPMAARIPLLIGGTDSELSMSASDAVMAMDDAALLARLRRFIGDAAAEVAATFRADHPRATPGELFVLIATGLWTTKRSVQLAERHAALKGAPTYMYLWTWRSPLAGGKYMSQHGIDLPFVWDNVAAGYHRVGKGPGHQALADRVSARWLAFARGGSPNAPGLVRWEPFDTARRATLLIDTKDRLADDPRQGERLALAALPPEASTGALGALR
jgi:para-nitrobenzyl esterase